MITVTKSYLPRKEELFNYIDQIYESCQLTNFGSLAQKLELQLANYLGVRNIILVANGTIALQVAYKALNIQGSAITTPFSFPATTSTLVWDNIRPIFVDIDPESWNINPKGIESKIESDTTAIVATHVFGNPCQVEAIQTIAKQHHLKVIYDGAHSFGVRHKEKSILNWGDVATASFHATKLFHTIEGGAIITNDDKLASKIRLMINFGIGEGKVLDLGINAKFNEFQAAMGLCVLNDIDFIHQERRKIWFIYHEHLKGMLAFQNRNKFSTDNFSYFPVIFENENILKKVQTQLNEKNYHPRRYFYPSLDTLPYILSNEPMPIAKNIASRILCLPLYPELPLDIVNDISYIIRNLVQEVSHS